ncbi:MAG: DUF6788 family protein [Planctomycetota bacterium]|jgi:hypothetical protein
MRHANSLYFERRTASLLKRLSKVGPFVAATLACVRHRCGNPRCRCAAGHKHPSWRLTYKDANQKTVSVYVPVGMLEEVRQWLKNYRAFKKLAAEISDAQLKRVKLYVREKRRKTR